MFHGSFPNLGGVLAYALQEVLELGHGGLLDLLPQLGDGLGHGLREPVRGHARQVCVLQLFQGLQCWVVPARSNPTSKSRKN